MSRPIGIRSYCRYCYFRRTYLTTPNSLSDVNPLHDDSARMQFESSRSEKEFTDDVVNLQVWNEIESESDAEFQKDHGIVEKK
jgi:hypothetical protein